MSNESKPAKKRLLAGIGLVIGLVALTSAFLSSSLAEVIDPPTAPVEEVAVDLASRFIGAAKAKVSGEEYKSVAITKPLPSRFIYPVVVGLGMLAAGLGIVAFIRSEDRAMAGGAIALGVGAAVVQWSVIMVGAILLILLVIVIIGALTGGGI